MATIVFKSLTIHHYVWQLKIRSHHGYATLHVTNTGVQNLSRIQPGIYVLKIASKSGMKNQMDTSAVQLEPHMEEGLDICRVFSNHAFHVAKIIHLPIGEVFIAPKSGVRQILPLLIQYVLQLIQISVVAFANIMVGAQVPFSLEEEILHAIKQHILDLDVARPVLFGEPTAIVTPNA